MDDLVKNLIIFVILPFVGAIGAYFMKTHVDRIEQLEKSIALKTTEPEVRLIIADKTDPIKEDIKEIKADISKILDILLKK